MLTAAQAEYLVHHGVPLSRVLDATGLQGKRLRQAMTDADALVAVNTNSCSRSFSHRMKLRSGHCAQCKPEGLGFALRNENAGIVYVASSSATGLVKVRSAGHVQTRIVELNRKGYGEVYDWEAVFQHQVSSAGRVEASAHAILERWRVDRTYRWAGSVRSCYEIYGCSMDDAVRAVSLAADESFGST
jgi:hypothetical protein